MDIQQDESIAIQDMLIEQCKKSKVPDVLPPQNALTVEGVIYDLCNHEKLFVYSQWVNTRDSGNQL
jgi:hypothetical protein